MRLQDVSKAVMHGCAWVVMGSVAVMLFKVAFILPFCQ